MPFVDDSCGPEESGRPNKTFEPFWSSRKPSAAMNSRPNDIKVSDEELRATQTRLHLLLIEAQNQLLRERGLVRIIPIRGSSNKASAEDGPADDSSTSDDKAK